MITLTTKYRAGNRVLLTAKFNGRTRYLSGLVRRFDPTPGNEPVWQEQIHNGDFHNVSGDMAARLEAYFSTMSFFA